MVVCEDQTRGAGAVVAAPPGVERHWLWRMSFAGWVLRARPDAPTPDGRIQANAAGDPGIPSATLAELTPPHVRDAFLTAVFAKHRLRLTRPTDQRDLQALHAREKYLLMAHSPDTYRRLGRAVSGRPTEPVRRLADRYCREACAALQVPATRARHSSALQHMAGYFKRSLPSAERARMHEAIADFRAGLAPLTEPLHLIRAAAQATRTDYIFRQSYLAPYPWPLLLRTWL